MKLTLDKLEALAHHENNNKSKERLCDYIGYLWWLIQDNYPLFEKELQKDYAKFQETVE